MKNNILERKKKKIDYEALGSSFMRIPCMKPATARYLLDLGLKDTFELMGRCPDSLFSQIKQLKGLIPEETLSHLKLAVYFVENENPDPKKLKLEYWLY